MSPPPRLPTMPEWAWLLLSLVAGGSCYGGPLSHLPPPQQPHDPFRPTAPAEDYPPGVLSTPDPLAAAAPPPVQFWDPPSAEAEVEDHSLFHYPQLGGPPQLPGPPPPYDNPAFYGLTPGCAKWEVVKSHIYTLWEPIVIGVVGIIVFLVFKNSVIPWLTFWARSLERSTDDGGDLEERRSMVLDDLAGRVLPCLEQAACQFGLRAKHYTLTNAVVRAIDVSKDKPRFAEVFRNAATGQIDSCQPYATSCYDNNNKENQQKKRKSAQRENDLTSNHLK